MSWANPDVDSELSEGEGGCITPCADDDAPDGSGLACVGASKSEFIADDDANGSG